MWLFRFPHPTPAACGGIPSPLLNFVLESRWGRGEADGLRYVPDDFGTHPQPVTV